MRVAIPIPTYLVLGNLPQELRQKLRNNFDLGLIPAGVSFKDYIQPFMRELEDLQRGQRWRIGNNEYWVVAGTKLYFFAGVIKCIAHFLFDFWLRIRCSYPRSSPGKHTSLYQKTKFSSRLQILHNRINLLA